jgi:hypothetical protein
MTTRKTSDGIQIHIYEDGIVFMAGRTTAYNRRPLSREQGAMLADIVSEVSGADLGPAIDAVRAANGATAALRMVEKNSAREFPVGA